MGRSGEPSRGGAEAAPEATAVGRVLGLAYREVGRIDEARATMAAAGGASVALPDPWFDELRQIDIGAYLADAVQARLREDWDEAARLYRLAADADPDRSDPATADALRGLAEVLFVLGDGPGAVSVSKKDPGLARECRPSRQAGRGLSLIPQTRRRGGALPPGPGAGAARSEFPSRSGAGAGHDRTPRGGAGALRPLPGSGARPRGSAGAQGAGALPLGTPRRGGRRPGRGAGRAARQRAGAPGPRRRAGAGGRHGGGARHAGGGLGGQPRSAPGGGAGSGADRRPRPGAARPERAVRLGTELLQSDPSVSHAIVLARALFAAGRVAEAAGLQERALREARSAGGSRRASWPPWSRCSASTAADSTGAGRDEMRRRCRSAARADLRRGRSRRANSRRNPAGEDRAEATLRRAGRRSRSRLHLPQRHGRVHAPGGDQRWRLGAFRLRRRRRSRHLRHPGPHADARRDPSVPKTRRPSVPQ